MQLLALNTNGHWPIAHISASLHGRANMKIEHIKQGLRGYDSQMLNLRQLLEPCFCVRIAFLRGLKEVPVLAGSKPGARSAPTAAQKAAAGQGQPKGETGKDGEEGEAEKPPDTRTWLQVRFHGTRQSLIDNLHHAVTLCTRLLSPQT